MPTLKQIAQDNDDFFESEEGIRSLKNAARRHKRHKAEIAKCHEQLSSLTNEQFLKYIIKQIGSHGPDWIDKCHKKGIEPYSKGELSLTIKVIEEYGKNTIPRKWDMFASFYKTYKGLRLIKYNGQGSFYRIYRSKELLIQI